MAAIKNKPAAGTYTVNTAHAKCPNHLWMFDEGTGTPVDKGKTGGVNLSTTVGDPAWGTADLGTTGPGGETSSVICNFDGVGDAFRSSTTFSCLNTNGYNAMLILVIFKTTNSTATGSQVLVDIANSANSTDYFRMSNASDTNIKATYDDSVVNSVSPTGWAAWDQAWHLAVGRHYRDTTPDPDAIRVGVSLDGASFTGHTSTGNQNGAVYGMNRVAVGDRAGSSSGNEFFGDIAAVMIWLDDANPASNWNDAFVSSIYNDPWQFLTTTTKKLKLVAHGSAAGLTGFEGVVLNSTRDTVIGEFTGQSFSATLESGKAVMKIPTSAISPNGDNLTTSDTPLAVAYNTVKTTSLVSCTVIEE